MAKYLDLTGLSHYDQKIKQYIAQHSGGSILYKHNIQLSNAGGNNEIIYLTIITSSAIALTSATWYNVISNYGTIFALQKNGSYDAPYIVAINGEYMYWFNYETTDAYDLGDCVLINDIVTQL